MKLFLAILGTLIIAGTLVAIHGIITAPEGGYKEEDQRTG